jgi:DNA-directed RNA polymerase subunit RPC12/RpoP
MTIQLRNVVQCPHCGFKTTEQMPSVTKQMAYTCPACGVTTTVTEEQCCVFCHIGRIPCPAKQKDK